MELDFEAYAGWSLPRALWAKFARHTISLPSSRVECRGWHRRSWDAPLGPGYRWDKGNGQPILLYDPTGGCNEHRSQGMLIGYEAASTDAAPATAAAL